MKKITTFTLFKLLTYTTFVHCTCSLIPKLYTLCLHVPDGASQGVCCEPTTTDPSTKQDSLMMDNRGGSFSIIGLKVENVYLIGKRVVFKILVTQCLITDNSSLKIL